MTIHVLLTALVSLAPTTPAIPIDRPTVIVESGSYELVSDLEGLGGPALVIRAPVVYLDLGPHAITGGPGVDLILLEAPATRVSLRGGRLAGGRRQVRGTVAEVLDIEGTAFSGASEGGVLATAPAFRIHAAEFLGSRHHPQFADEAAINVIGDAARITGTVISDYCERGIFLWGVRRGLLAGNAVSDLGCMSGQGEGILVIGSGLVIRDNAIQRCRGGGIHARDGNTITGNWIEEIEEGYAIGVGSDNLVEDNHLRHCGDPDDGPYVCFTIGSGNTVRRNAVSDGALECAQVRGHDNLLDGNAFTHCRYGIGFREDSSGNGYRNNDLRWNGYGPVLDEGTDNIDLGGNTTD